MDLWVGTTNPSGLVELRPTLGTGRYQEVRASISDDYFFAKYEFVRTFSRPAQGGVEPEWTTGRDYLDRWGRALPHDGRILETEHFLVFSDGSTDETRLQIAEMAEESFAEILAAFGIAGPEQIGVFTDRQETKLEIYCSNKTEVEVRSRVGGFSIYDPNHPVWDLPTAPDGALNYRNTVKHEIVHLVQFAIGVGDASPWGDSWFFEGVAEYLSGGSFPPIRDEAELEAWFADPIQVTPILVRTYWAPIPDGALVGDYYPLFGLAVTYLLDQKGFGKTPADVKALFVDMASGMEFSEAFQLHLGFSRAMFQEQFQRGISEFLKIY